MKTKPTLMLGVLQASVLISGLLIAEHGYADFAATSSEKNQAFNMCPAGIPLGAYSINYEYLLKRQHGLVFRLDYEDVPDTYTQAKINSTGKAFVLAYRWHFTPSMASFYVGPYFRHRVYEGSGKSNNPPFDFTLTEQTLGLNVGKRWVWDNGLNLNLAFGYGVAGLSRKITQSNSAIEANVRQYEKYYGHLGAFLGEFSVGYNF